MIFLFLSLVQVALSANLVTQPSPYSPDFLQEMEVGRDVKLDNLWHYRFAVPLLMHAGVLTEMKPTISFNPKKSSHLRDMFPLLLLPTLPQAWDFDYPFGSIPKEHLINAPKRLTIETLYNILAAWHKSSGFEPINYAELARKYGLLQVLCLIEELASFSSEKPTFVEEKAFVSLSRYLDGLAVKLYYSSPTDRQLNGFAAAMSRNMDFMKILEILLHNEPRLKLYISSLNQRDVPLPAKVSHQDQACVTSLIVPLMKQTLNSPGFQFYIHEAEVSLFERHFSDDECERFIQSQFQIYQKYGEYMEPVSRRSHCDEGEVKALAQMMRRRGVGRKVHASGDINAFITRRLVAFATADHPVAASSLDYSSRYFVIPIEKIDSGAIMRDHWFLNVAEINGILELVRSPESFETVVWRRLIMAYAIKSDIPFQSKWKFEMKGDLTFGGFGFKPMIEAALKAGREDVVNEILREGLIFPGIEEHCPRIAQLDFTTIEKIMTNLDRYICVDEVLSKQGRLPILPRANYELKSLMNHLAVNENGSLLAAAIIGKKEQDIAQLERLKSAVIKARLIEIGKELPIWFLAQTRTTMFIRADILPAYESTSYIRALFMSSTMLRVHAHEIAHQLLDDVLADGVPKDKYFILVDLLFDILPSAIKDESQLSRYLKRMYEEPTVFELFPAEKSYMADYLEHVLRGRVYSQLFLNSSEGIWLKGLVDSVLGTSKEKTNTRSMLRPGQELHPKQILDRHRAIGWRRQKGARYFAIQAARGRNVRQGGVHAQVGNIAMID